MSIQITITNAGRAEIINAANTGTAPVTITHVGVGTGQYVPAATQTTLQAETKRLATIAGQVVADDTIHITIKDESNDAYNVSEFGLFTDSGTLFAVYSQNTGPFMQKAGPSTLLLSVDILLGTLDANNIAFGETGFSNPPASETVAGVVELATPAETATGTDAARAVTPAGLKPLLDVRQPLDATLTALAALATVADRLIYATGPDTFATTALSAFIRTLLDDTDAAAARTTLGAAPLASPGFTGAPTAPTAVTGTNTTQLATTAFVQAAVAAILDSSPATLDTLNELAAALGDDPNFATTITNALGLKAPLASPEFTGSPTAPTPAQFDNDTSVATTEFVQRALGNCRTLLTIAASTTLTDAHLGAALLVNGNYTVTLPLAASFTSGQVIRLVNPNSGNSFTVQRQGAEVVDIGGAAVTSIIVQGGETLTLLSNSAGRWIVIEGTAALGNFGRFTASLAANGYQKLPSGLILQWGTGNIGSFTFPIVFPNACRGVFIQNNDLTRTAVTTFSSSGFSASSDIGSGDGIYWFAFGH